MLTYENRSDTHRQWLISALDIHLQLHKKFWPWLLVILTAYAVGHGAIHRVLNLGEYATGRHFMIVTVFCAMLYILMVSRCYWPVQAEVIMFGLWLLWSLGGAGESLLTNPLAPEGFWAAYRWAVVIGLVFFLSAGITTIRKSMTPSFLGFMVGCLILMFIAVYTGDYRETIISETQQFGELTAGNANTFSYCLFFGVVAAAYFVSNSSGRMIRILTVLTLLMFTIGIVLSASRKALLTECLFITLWLYFSYRHQLFHRPRTIVIATILIGSIYISATYVMNNMLIGKRFKQDTTLQHEEDRIDKYLEAPVMIRKEPIFGIGLGNFANQSRSDRPSHSDYVGVITETGIPGAILYFSIYVILWRRLSQMQVLGTHPRTVRTIGVLKAAIISILCIALGRWNYDDPMTYALLGSAAGFSWWQNGIESSPKRSLTSKR